MLSAHKNKEKRLCNAPLFVKRVSFPTSMYREAESGSWAKTQTFLHYCFQNSLHTKIKHIKRSLHKRSYQEPNLRRQAGFHLIQRGPNLVRKVSRCKGTRPNTEPQPNCEKPLELETPTLVPKWQPPVSMIFGPCEARDLKTFLRLATPQEGNKAWEGQSDPWEYLRVPLSPAIGRAHFLLGASQGPAAQLDGYYMPECCMYSLMPHRLQFTFRAPL